MFLFIYRRKFYTKHAAKMQGEICFARLYKIWASSYFLTIFLVISEPFGIS